MTALQHGCSRHDCCERRPPSEENDLDVVAARVVKEVAALHIEAPPLDRSSPYRALTYSSNLATAVNRALQDALSEPDHEFRVVNHPDSTRDHHWVGRYRVVRKPHRTVALDFVVAGGLCVVTNRHGSWIVHSPARGPAASATPGP